MEEAFTLESAIAAIDTDPMHPGLRRMSFIFCDDKPNANNQGIEQEDFADIMRTAIGTPLKVKFFGQAVGGHQGSVPIGFIQSMREEKGPDGENLLMADATLFAAEYPDEVDWLEKKHKEGKAPGISWELVRTKEPLIKSGIQWLKGVITKAATIVGNPAYGKRTAILALASNNEISEADLINNINLLVGGTTEPQNIIDEPKNTDRGGNNRMEEELKNLRAEVESLKTRAETAEADLATVKTENETLKQTITTQTQELSEFKNKETLASRTEALKTAGITIELKPERILSMDEASFTEYVDEMKSVAEAAKKAGTGRVEIASARKGTQMPKFGTTETTPTSKDSLIDRFRTLSRSSMTTAEGTE